MLQACRSVRQRSVEQEPLELIDVLASPVEPSRSSAKAGLGRVQKNASNCGRTDSTVLMISARMVSTGQSLIADSGFGIFSKLGYPLG